jgi:hypothetical protein
MSLFDNNTINLNFLNKIHRHRKTLLKELYEYLLSSEVARVYNYTLEGSINQNYEKGKIIKENCKDVFKWLNTKNTDIIAKQVVLKLDGRRSLVPFHHMYVNPIGSMIFNEDCIFNSKYFQKSLNLCFNEMSYGVAFMLIKSHGKAIFHHSTCQPYIMMYLNLLNNCNLKVTNDFHTTDIKSSYCCYFRSNTVFENLNSNYSISIINNKWLFSRTAFNHSTP